jgi:superfamily II DNA or RNA helicase
MEERGWRVELRLAVGARVSHRETGELGVVLGFHDSDVEVAFGSVTQILAAEDLIQAPTDDAQYLIKGELGEPTAAWLRLLGRLVRHSYEFDPGAGLSNARLEPQLHQAFVAHRVVARKLVPRMILADEVGLGKTIEAGLILKELRARGLADRVLIITPASLTRQWQVELQSKFNERFELMDGNAAKHFGRGGANPFASSDSIICSLPFASAKKRQEQIIETPWDLVIFDEAHRVRRTKASTTQAYRLADELRDLTHGLLLLSATPIQLHPMELYSLIDLVEPGLFAGFQAYEAQRAQIPKLNQLMRLMDSWPTLPAEDKESMWGLHRGLLGNLGVASQDELTDGDRRDAVMDRIIEAHPTADVMVRNRKVELGIGSERKAHTVPVPQTDIEREVYELATEYIRDSAAGSVGRSNAVGFLMVTYQRMLTSSSHALRTSLRRRITKLRAQLTKLANLKQAGLSEEAMDAEEISETLEGLEEYIIEAEEAAVRGEIALLENLVERLDEVRDSKAVTLFDVLREIDAHGEQKVVLFTQFVETQLFLKTVLESNGYSVTIFNGRMGAEEKEDAIRQFRESSQILISTEAGGEGRNLQFAHVLINYDLPWNPMKVEQRIGRLDRIGQTHVVDIFNLVYQGTLEERIVDVLQHRIRVFEESVGSLDPILGTLEEELQDIALNTPLSDLEDRFEQFGNRVEREVEKARLLEARMADFVLDRASFRRDQARQLQEQPSLASNEDLKSVVSHGLDYLGGSLNPHDAGGEQVSLSPKLASRIGLTQQAHHGIFDPLLALRMDEVPFFACGHPVIDKILDAMVALDARVAGRRSAEAPPGVSVEIIWRLKASLVIPEAKLIRHVISPNLTLSETDVSSLPLGDAPIDVTIEPDFASQAVALSRSAFTQALHEYRGEMQAKAEDILERRLRRLTRVHKSQVERIQVRIDEEVDFIRRAESDPTPQTMKILPARKGRLNKARERMDQLNATYERESEELKAKRPDIRGEIFAVSVLVGS